MYHESFLMVLHDGFYKVLNVLSYVTVLFYLSTSFECWIFRLSPSNRVDKFQDSGLKTTWLWEPLRFNQAVYSLYHGRRRSNLASILTSSVKYCGSELSSSHIPDLFCSYYVAVIRKKNHATYKLTFMLLLIVFVYRHVRTSLIDPNCK